jgi:chromosome condensin MukBEF complex kleisin-like MukF subunit
VIVRLMGEGQYEVDDAAAERLNEIDEAAVQAVEAGDEDELRRRLEELAQAVRDSGTRLDDAHLGASDLIVPPSDLSLDEARALFTEEGLIPDLPLAGD